MKISGLYSIVDPSITPEAAPERLALDYLKGGAAILQLREKILASAGKQRLFLEAARKISVLKKDYRFLFIVNDYLDIALEAGADGVHVGKDDPPIEECRRLLGPDRLIGYSSHSLEEAVEAEKRGADYVAFGAIYPTPTKGPGHPIQGSGRLKEVVQTLKIPVVAIGGIGRENIKEVLATGVPSVAMISALAGAGNRIAEARFFATLFHNSPRPPLTLRGGDQ